MEQKSPDIIYAQIVAGKLYASKEPNEVFGKQFPQYIHKDVVDETIKTAEDHAFFAGQEKLREKLLEWAKEKASDYKGTANIRRSFELMIKKIESL